MVGARACERHRMRFFVHDLQLAKDELSGAKQVRTDLERTQIPSPKRTARAIPTIPVSAAILVIGVGLGFAIPKLLSHDVQSSPPMSASVTTTAKPQNIDAAPQGLKLDNNLEAFASRLKPRP